MPGERHSSPECDSLTAEIDEAREALLIEFVSEWEREHTDARTRPLAFAVQRAVEHHIEHHERYEALTRGANLLAQQLRETLARVAELESQVAELQDV